MRLQSKYKKFSKLKFIFKDFPKKLLQFHRTKWKKVQQLILTKRTSKQKLFWSSKTLLYTRRWHLCKAKYSTSVYLKVYFDCLFDEAFSFTFYKNLKYLNKNLDKLLDFVIYIIRPLFRLDVFLWKLHFFASSYQSRQYVNNKKIKVNGDTITPNYFLKKGDIISFDNSSYCVNNVLYSLLIKNINTSKLNTFIEVDHYTNTMIILKDYKNITENDIMFFTTNYDNINQFKTFIK